MHRLSRFKMVIMMKRTLFMSSVYLILSGLIIFFADYLTTPFIQKLYGSGISLEIVVRIRYSISVILSVIVWKKREQNLLQVKIISKCIFGYVILSLLLKTFFRSSVIITWAVTIISIPVNIFTCYYDFVLAFSTHPIAYIVGFLLSLLLPFLMYYLITKETKEFDSKP